MDADEGPTDHGEPASSSFEAEIRQQRELMQQMAGRENWEGDSPFNIQMRRIGGGLIYLLAVAGVAFIIWAIAFVILNS